MLPDRAIKGDDGSENPIAKFIKPVKRQNYGIAPNVSDFADKLLKKTQAELYKFALNHHEEGQGRAIQQHVHQLAFNMQNMFVSLAQRSFGHFAAVSIEPSDAESNDESMKTNDTKAQESSEEEEVEERQTSTPTHMKAHSSNYVTPKSNRKSRKHVTPKYLAEFERQPLKKYKKSTQEESQSKSQNKAANKEKKQKLIDEQLGLNFDEVDSD